MINNTLATASGMSSTEVRMENQTYVRSLEGFVDSNIKCINSLIEYKQKTNEDIVKMNNLIQSAHSDLTFLQKRNSQIRAELATAQANSLLIK